VNMRQSVMVELPIVVTTTLAKNMELYMSQLVVGVAFKFIIPKPLQPVSSTALISCCSSSFVIHWWLAAHNTGNYTGVLLLLHTIFVL
jgi:hypothetical protein